MKAFTFKTETEDGYPVKNIGYIRERDRSYIYLRRMLIPVKFLEEYTICGYVVLKTYKDSILIQESMAFYPSTFKTLFEGFREL